MGPFPSSSLAVPLLAGAGFGLTVGLFSLAFPITIAGQMAVALSAAILLRIVAQPKRGPWIAGAAAAAAVTALVQATFYRTYGALRPHLWEDTHQSHWWAIAAALLAANLLAVAPGIVAMWLPSRRKPAGTDGRDAPPQKIY